jgi:two-component system CitB family sensor kinase
VLHTVREGLLLLDRSGRVQLANDEARRLLSVPADAIGRSVDQIGLPGPLCDALTAGRDRVDELHLAGDRVLLLNQVRTRWYGRDLGSVVTMRDHTELRALTSELDSIRGLAESLHAQTHEAANQLHTVISLIELGRPAEALEYATGELAVAQHLTDRVVGAVAEPVLAALLIGKAAEAGERGVDLSIADDTRVPAGAVDPRDLVTIAGNLIDNAIDAAVAAPGPRRVSFGAVHTGTHLVLRVADSGGGLDPAAVQRAFQRGWSTKEVPGRSGDGTRHPGRGLGLALVAQAVHRYGGWTEVSRQDGAVFTVHLPVRRATRSDPDGSAGPAHRSSSAVGVGPVAGDQSAAAGPRQDAR